MDNNDWQEKKKELKENKLSSSFEEKESEQSEQNDNKNAEEEKINSNEDKVEIKDDESFEDYITRIRSKYKYDPRPDLEEDSQLWKKILKLAEGIDKKAYHILHGFRCGGAKLEIKNDKVNMKPRIGKNHLWQSQEEYNKDRKQWLMPLKDSISEIFDALELN